MSSQVSHTRGGVILAQRVVPQSHVLIGGIFGEYVRRRGRDIWIGSLIEALRPFGVSGQAARSAVSRMTRQGLLKGFKVGSRSFYALTEKGEATRRRRVGWTFMRKVRPWDGRWHMVVYNIPESQKEVRNRLRLLLSRLGYGNLSSSVWISPFTDHEELDAFLEDLGFRIWVRTFTIEPEDKDAVGLVKAVWDIDQLADSYTSFLNRWKSLLGDLGDSFPSGTGEDDAKCFALRHQLMTDYFQVSNIDPHLPPELLPANWCGERARMLFEKYHGTLSTAANRFFDSIYVNSKMGIPSHWSRISTSTEKPHYILS